MMDATDRRPGFRSDGGPRSRSLRRAAALLGVGFLLVNPLFDADFYARLYPDVPRGRRRGWLHYVRHGAHENRAPSPWFDTAWYRQSYPDVAASQLNPLDHYFWFGWHEGRDPSPAFSTTRYLASHPDVRATGVNPLLHYLMSGGDAERSARSEPSDMADVAAAKLYAEQVLRTGMRDDHSYTPFRAHPEETRRVKAIAFYLPQFHPIPENDEWWGKGFTEWANVTRAVPQFVGHYQPRLPGDLGFYDLRVPDILRAQVDLARNYGISGFCFHYYWFGGRRLLERPLESYLQDRSLDLPFCVSWANENWTRRWDGRNDDILIAQPNDPDVDMEFARSVVPLMRDERYLRVDGLPLLLVYRPGQLVDAAASASQWRQTFRDEGIGEVLLARVQFDEEDPRPFGFDVAIEFPPHKLGRGLARIEGDLSVLNPEYQGTVHRYEDIVAVAEQVVEHDYPLMRGAMPGWDNTARNPERGLCYHGSTPDLYRRWLADSSRYALQHPVRDEAVVFINAWNEWAEGAYLEPDRRNGYAYLEATRAAITEAERSRTHVAQKLLLLVHDAANHGAQRLALNLARTMREVFDVHLDIALMEDGPLAGEFREYGNVHRLDAYQYDREAQDAVLREIRDGGTNVAICNTVVTGHYVRRLSQMGYHVLSLVHELPGIIDQYSIMPEARSIARHADTIVFASDHVRIHWERTIGPISTETVIRPQGLYRRPRSWQLSPADRRLARLGLGLPEDREVVLAVGYADLRKGVDIFVRVFEAVRRERPNAVFIWLGCEDPEQLFWFGREAEALGFGDSLRLVPRVEDVEPYYEAASLLLLPSREDPFPSVVLEALSHSVPAIAFEGATGSVDLLERGAGVVVPYGDTAAMAAATIRLLDDPARARMGEVGQAIIREEFDWTDYVSDLLALSGYRRPSVSVVLPNYNYARFLQQRLASIAHQDYPIKELIVLDDASTDGSVEAIERICGELGLRNVIMEFNEENSGSVSMQWARGVGIATGDLVWIAEADDFAEPQFLSRVVPCFDDPETVLAYSESRQVGPDGHFMASHYRDYVSDVDRWKWLTSWHRPGLAELADSLSVKNTIPSVSAVLLRRERLVEALSGDIEWITGFRTAGDWATYVSVLRRGGYIEFVAEPLNNHRRHEAGVVIGSSGASIISEVGRMQADIRSRVEVPDHALKQGALYLQSLMVQFSEGPDPASAPSKE